MRSPNMSLDLYGNADLLFLLFLFFFFLDLHANTDLLDLHANADLLLLQFLFFFFFLFFCSGHRSVNMISQDRLFEERSNMAVW